MSTHIGARKGQIAKTVYITGDPVRAEVLAMSLLEGPKLVNKVRGERAFTGYYKGHRVTIMSTGIGEESLGIYVFELIKCYGVKRIIRVGTCGSFDKQLDVGDIFIAQGASTDSSFNTIRFGGLHYAPLADFKLLQGAVSAAAKHKIPVTVGNVLATIFFYHPKKSAWKLWKKYGVKAVEMEAAELYTRAAELGIEALTILTVSDSLVTGKKLTSRQREFCGLRMMRIALELAL